ncbi:MAG: ATP-binding cassette domain-containing protein [Deltaproteobacteria bacterium]|nr:ATP-binding cassette domain-containing protein [Deltaproteobacteria bacterium]
MIEVEGLSKTYRISRKSAGLAASMRALFRRTTEEVRAVQDVSFSLAPGERIGFLGPNGAGKTTTLKMLAGLLTPTAGRISVDGYDPRHRPRELLRRISLVMGQKQQLIWDLPPIDTLELNRAVYEIPRADYRRTLDELTSMLSLGDLLDKPARQLSLGERMKCELAAALIHRPKVLFLDEPTIGLDVSMQATVRTFIRAYNEATQATIILTSHYMDDVAELCPRVIIIDKGALRHDGRLAALVANSPLQRQVRVVLQRCVAAEDLAAINRLAPAATISRREDSEITLLVAPDGVTTVVRDLLRDLPIANLSVEDPPLEEIMRRLFDREAPDAQQAHEMAGIVQSPIP